MAFLLRKRNFAIRVVRLVGARPTALFDRHFNCHAAAPARAIAALRQKPICHYLGGRRCIAAFYFCLHGGADGGRKQATGDY